MNPGTRLGPFEVIAPLGAGGMGEVWRARDVRLGRDVAIKVLPEALAKDPDALARFEREARAVAALSHPNILSIFDFGTHEGTAFAVMELLEGETLRDRLSAGPMSVRKAVELAREIALGLAAAHEKGMVHRDIKPENVFVTAGNAKILDFGLARHFEAASGLKTNSPTQSGVTLPGTVLGTISYMSPEQARGETVDARSDIFSLGCVLYEMLSGRKAFERQTTAETLAAILKDEPPDLSSWGAAIPNALEHGVRHCLEKRREERFQCARDLAFLLQTSLGELTQSPTTANAAARAATYRRLTFRRGNLISARFTPDGEGFVYAAAWDGQPPEISLGRLDSVESRSFGLPPANLAAVSSRGDMAVLLGCRSDPYGGLAEGLLARVDLAGGAQREILPRVYWADWGPDGKPAVVRWQSGDQLFNLEYPIGRTLYRAREIRFPRFSPKGDLIAVWSTMWTDEDGGTVALVDLDGHARIISRGWSAVDGGLAWSPDGTEVWFSASRGSPARCGPRGLHAVNLDGEESVIQRLPGRFVLQDISRQGKLLVTHGAVRTGILGLSPGESTERDLSWLDGSLLMDVSADGRLVLFSELGGPAFSCYVRKTDGSPAIRLSEGACALAISPDGKWALSTGSSLAEFHLHPTGAGEVKVLSLGGVRFQMFNGGAVFFADGKRLLFWGVEEGRRWRSYVLDVDGGTPRPVTPEGILALNVSPDGRFVCGQPPVLYPVEGGEPVPVPGSLGSDSPIGWDESGRRLYVHQMGEVPARVFRLDPETGERAFVRELMPSDPAGVMAVGPIRMAPDGQSYVYSYHRVTSDLYLVEGLT